MLTKSEAIDASIEHWKQNRDAKTPWEVSTDVSACALCDLYYSNGCKGCPVSENTGKTRCGGTPYFAARAALVDWGFNLGEKNTFIEACQRQIDYLESLRNTPSPRKASYSQLHVE